jgi:hypothetical protein
MSETVIKKDDISGVIKFTDEELTEAKLPRKNGQTWSTFPR